MGDLPVRGTREVEDSKESKLPGVEQQGTPLQLGNVEIIKIKLLESIQNQLIYLSKIVAKIAEKQGVDLTEITK